MDNQHLNAYIMSKTPKRGFGFIYKYTAPSGKSYIGQTIQKMSDRARNGKGYRKNTVFYKAINKYGFKSMTVEILGEVEIEFLDDAEKNCIELHSTLVPNGYNILKDSNPVTTKKVYKYDRISGNYLDSYESIAEAARAVGATFTGGIGRCVNNKQKTAHNFIWSTNYSKQVNPETEFKGNTAKKVYAFDLGGEFLEEFPSITSAAKSVGATNGDIRKCCNGKLKFVHGIIWSFSKNSPEPVTTGKNGSMPVRQINPNTMEIISTHKSISEAGRKTGISNSGIAKTCQGKQKSSGGYFWEYV